MPIGNIFFDVVITSSTARVASSRHECAPEDDRSFARDETPRTTGARAEHNARDAMANA